MLNRMSTFIFQRESLINAGFFDGDELVVDRSIEPKRGDVVLACVDNEFTVKRLCKRAGVVKLVPAHPAFDLLTVYRLADADVRSKVSARRSLNWSFSFDAFIVGNLPDCRRRKEHLRMSPMADLPAADAVRDPYRESFGRPPRLLNYLPSDGSRTGRAYDKAPRRTREEGLTLPCRRGGGARWILPRCAG